MRDDQENPWDNDDRDPINRGGGWGALSIVILMTALFLAAVALFAPDFGP